MDAETAMNAIITRRLIVALITFAMPLAAMGGDLFRWVDKDGRVYYSDTPPPAEAKNVQQKRYPGGTGDSGEIPYAVKVAMENNPVTLYATNCVEGCAEARDLLAKRGIPFTDRNPETDGKAREALAALTEGALVIPTLAVGQNTLKGLSVSGWHAALDTAGYPRTNPNLRPGTVPPATPPKATDSAAGK
jgi:hypothetical protein